MTLSQTYNVKHKFRALVSCHLAVWGAIELCTMRKFWKAAHK